MAMQIKLIVVVVVVVVVVVERAIYVFVKIHQLKYIELRGQ